MKKEDYINTLRAFGGQGLMLGWGDEAEAWVRSRLADEDYEQSLAQIQQSYGDFAEDNPILQTGAEFAGAVVPGVASMMIPGMQTTAGVTTAGALGRLGALGAATGAVSGAGYAQEGSKAAAVLPGAAIGGALGTALPIAARGIGALGRAGMERFSSSDDIATSGAARRMLGALNETGGSPAGIANDIGSYQGMGVPAVVANVNSGLADLAETVAQRSGGGARKIEETLTSQRMGAKERVNQQVRKGLQPGDYYDDLEKLQSEMRARAKEAYSKAYADGVVTDPAVLKFLKLPQFQQGVGEAQKLLAAEGKKLNMKKIDVQALDNIKRGVDSLIEKQTDPVTGRVTNLGRIYVEQKNKFLRELDRVSPDYAAARAIYAGDAEMSSAMRSGMNEFRRMDHEQVIKKIAGMSEAEKHAFRTGVTRDIQSMIMDPSQSINAAQKIVGSPEMRAKLQPLFDNPGQFSLFEAALMRESQLFQNANKILGGSQTSKREQMRSVLEGENTAGSITADMITGGVGNSLTNLVGNFFRVRAVPDNVAKKLADMLMSKDPSEVAAVVELLEKTSIAQTPKAVRSSAKQGGATTGTIGTMWVAPQGSEEEQPVE